jgi:hypothetical protein
MKKLAILLISIFAGSLYLTNAQTYDYAGNWAKILSFEAQGLPQSAKPVVVELYGHARTDKNYPEFIKAFIYRMKFKSKVEENELFKIIKDAEMVCDSAGFPVKPMMHSMLAEMYWWYFQNNRYKFYQRSRTLQVVSDDISTWDMTHLVWRVMDHYRNSLASSDSLKKIPLGTYNSILQIYNNYEDKIRPTLYDFLALRALEFYTNEESHLPLPINEFNINNTNYILPVEDFSRLNIENLDTLSFEFQSISLFQELVKFHLNDSTPDALIEVDLKRIKFIDALLTTEEKDDLYLKALYNLENKAKGSFWEPQIGMEIAERLFDIGELYNPQISQQYRWEKDKAIEKCMSIKALFPGMSGKCLTFVEKVHAKKLKLTIEKENIPNEPFCALLNYQNTDSVYVRIIKSNYDKLDNYNERYTKACASGYIAWDDFILPVLKNEKVLTQYIISLPKDKDYQEHATEIKLPALVPGVYIILVGSDKTFDFSKNSVTYGITNVTSISFINRKEANGDNVFYFLNRKTGEPIAGAEVECWANSYSYNSRSYKPTLQTSIITDMEGFAIISNEICKNVNYWFNISIGADQWNTKDITWFYTGSYFYNYETYDYKDPCRLHTYFFTDRAIYRPGQTIYFKGIVIETNRKNKSEIVPGYSMDVQLINVNNQQVSNIKVTTNEYGSFSGTFTAPSGGLNGAMYIRGNCGGKSIRVEDYKRPKFEVKFDTLRDSYKLNEIVTMKGKAVAYSGANIDNAMVKYRVVRRTNFYNWFWWFLPPQVPEKEITNGTTSTGSQGEFVVNFKAVPDGSIDASGRTSFTYVVYVDVTDMNGETHSSSRSVTIGFRALTVNINFPAKLDQNAGEDKFLINTKNVNGDFVAAMGRISIVRLKNPDKVFSDRKWASPDKFTMSKADFYKFFPASPYADELDPTTWSVIDTVFEIPFNTANEQQLELSNLKDWKTGMYKAVVSTEDMYRTKIEEEFYFTVFDARSGRLPYPMADWFHVAKTTLEPGDSVKVSLGSAFDNFSILCELEHQNKIVKKQWLRLKKGQKIFYYPILEEYRGNIGLHFTYVIDNRQYSHNVNITVPYTNKMIDLSFETFRNKLQPGEKEHWKIRLKDKYGEKVAAEMVTSLYDASLDVFARHGFDFDILPKYSPVLNWNAYNVFITEDFRTYSLQDYNTFSSAQNFYWFNWFGLDRSYNYDYDLSYRNYNLLQHQSYQPGRKVSGRVLDAATGEPLPGVNIIVVGTTRGTITDMNGDFTIFVPSLCSLEVSFVGYKSVKVQAKQNRKLTINLEYDMMSLDEIVVVGYGTKSYDEAIEATPAPVERKEEERKPDQANGGGENMMPVASKEEPNVDLSAIQARTNLNETAFFYPQLQTDENGDVIIDFTIPEALTRWRMLGFAHSKDLKYGFIENELVTQKVLMVVPNAPRFFRENDTIVFTSKITSLSDTDLKGSAQLLLFDALTMKSVDVEMQNSGARQDFEVKKGESINLTWRIIIPVGIQAVTYRIVAKAGNYSDGEESTLPVLTNSILLTETLPLPMKGKQTKSYTLDKLVHNTSTTLRNEKLTLEFTSNPAWYAIQALPYLMEYPYECAEQTFSRFYANSIASHIANSSPKIKQVFDSWRNTTPDALLSNLEKNLELKGLLLEETPWVLQAKDESERKRRVALLFDINKMSNELISALVKLKKMQVSNGGWPWFEGMPDDRYITQHIVCGMGKLDHLGIKNIRNDASSWRMTSNAIDYMDKRIAEDYRDLLKAVKAGHTSLSENHLGYLQIHYLYARSFFTDIPVSGNVAEAFNYYLNQAKVFWLRSDKYLQGMISLALHRYKDTKTPVSIIKSLKGHALTSEEMGMYWKNDYGWYWYQAPIETQAMMIEAFDEVMHDSLAVNEMKIWLIKQKQTQDWKTTRATVEACYALLLRGSDWLTNDDQVEITIGDQKLDPTKMPGVKVEAGTGYFKTSWNKEAIKPEMGNVTIRKNDNGISWGALYWQYFEQMDKITDAETPLKLKKQLFVERNTSSGPVIQLITDTTHLKPGDLIKVRIELRVDRNMEYVHMKDMRAAGLEPVNVLSRYKYQDGLFYYESTRDAATNFFFGWLPIGTHVFEYPLRVTHYGNFSNGITTIQCMYAPEFTSHSEGVRISVKEK